MKGRGRTGKSNTGQIRAQRDREGQDMKMESREGHGKTEKYRGGREDYVRAEKEQE
jgi:hypothetical protein